MLTNKLRQMFAALLADSLPTLENEMIPTEDYLNAVRGRDPEIAFVELEARYG